MFIKNNPQMRAPTSTTSPVGVRVPRGPKTGATPATPVKGTPFTSVSAGMQMSGKVGLEDFGSSQDLSPLLSGFSYAGEDPNNMGIYLDMYYYDSICGSAADIMATMPFSNFRLRDLSPNELKPFEDSLTRLRVGSLLPDATIDYLVTGTHCSTMLFDRADKIFLDTIPHSATNLEITHLPFKGEEPIIRVTFPQEIIDIMKDRSNPRIAELVKRYGSVIIDKIAAGLMDLDPLSTLYLPRRTLSSKGGISWFRRALPWYLYEKNIFRGTLAESVRRQRPITHIQIGDENWEPKPEDYQSIAQYFIDADQDPLGALVVTRQGLQVDEVRSSSDLWKIDDVWNTTMPAKLRALGIGESFVSGDQVYDCVVGSTLVPTAAGAFRIDELHPELHRCSGSKAQTFNIDLVVDGRHGPARATHVHYVGVAPCFAVEAAHHRVRGTPHHQLLTVDTNGAEEYRVLSRFNVGDWVACTTSTVPVTTPTEPRFQIGVEEARWLGQLYAVGKLVYDGHDCTGISISSSNETVVLAWAERACLMYGVDAREIELSRKQLEKSLLVTATITSTNLISRMRMLNVIVSERNYHQGLRAERLNPWPAPLMQGRNELALVFMAAVLDLRTSFKALRQGRPTVYFSSKFNNLTRLFLTLAQRFGIYCEMPSNSEIRLSAYNTMLLARALAPYIEVVHIEAVETENDNPVPISWLSARHPSCAWATEETVSTFQLAHDRKFSTFWANLAPEEALAVQTLLSKGHRWTKVTAAFPCESAKVYDLTIAQGQEPSYVVNGIVGHNTGQQGSISTMIEGVKAHRDRVQREMFYEKIFPLIALTNGMYKDSEAEKVAKARGGENAKDLSKVMSALRNINGLKIPRFEWEKPLRPEGDSAFFDTLVTLTEKGVPISLRALAAAAQVDIDAVEAGMPDDRRMRQKFGLFQKAIAKMAPSESGSGTADRVGDAAVEAGLDYDMAASLVSAFSPSLSDGRLPQDLVSYGQVVPSFRSSVLNHCGGRIPLTERKFDEEDAEIFTVSPTGKKGWIPNQHRAHRIANDLMIKAVRKHNKDKEQK